MEKANSEEFWNLVKSLVESDENSDGEPMYYILSDLPYYDKNFELIQERMVDYEEGSVATEYVVKYIPTGKFYAYVLYSNSWADYVDDEEPIVREVLPVQKTITVYE